MFCGGSKLKVKLKKEKMTSGNSFKELGFENWLALNQGKTIELKSIPDIAKKYLEKVKEKK